MAYDLGALQRPRAAMQLIDAIHLQEEADGSAIVIDDRTLTASHLNQAARVLLQALREPRTQQDLVAILADAASCGVEEAATPVAKLVEELESFGWIARQA